MEAANEVPNGDPADLAIAWTNASDREVVGALRDPDDFRPNVLPLINAEAARRNFDRNTEYPPVGIDATVIHAFLSWIGKTMTNRYVLAAAFGTLFPLGRTLNLVSSVNVPFWVEFTVLGPLSVAGLALAAWPLAEYGRAACIALAGAAGFTVVAALNAFIGVSGIWDMPIWLFPVAILLTLNFACSICFAPLAGLTFLRLRFWPVYPSGHCTACGYNLTGLTELRCPECGTQFTISSPLPGAQHATNRPSTNDATIQQRP